MQEEEKKTEEQQVTSDPQQEAQTGSEAEAEKTEETSPSESQTQSSDAKAMEDKPTKEPKAEEKPTREVSPELEKIIKSIETMTVLELADLVKALEERFGVTASAPMAMVSAPAAAAGEAVEEQTSFTVVLTSAGANKIGAIKAVREIIPTLGLKEAKDLVDSAPKPVLEGANKEAANEAKGKLEAAGATVELK